MKTVIIANIAVLILLFSTGCEPGGSVPFLRSASQSGILYAYAAAKIRIVGLTEVTASAQNPHASKLKAYIDVMDSFDCRIKSAGIFRFELYEFVPRSSQRMGKRLFAWPDINLTDHKKNNSYWRDHLRAYYFDLDLDLEPTTSATFILQTTCITPTGKRLCDILQLKYSQ